MNLLLDPLISIQYVGYFCVGFNYLQEASVVVMNQS